MHRSDTPTPRRVPLLFLVSDTGGGHRSAARAVAEALERAWPGRFAPEFCDPLLGPAAPAPLRRVAALYGPTVRRGARVWGAVYYAFSARVALRVLRGTLLALADRPVAEAVDRHRPAAIVSFHPLTGWAAVRAARRPGAEPVPVLTVVTDLVSAHPAWRYGAVDRILTPSDAVLRRCRRDGLAEDRCVEVGLPVASGFWAGPADGAERAALRRALGVGGDGLLVVLAGGAEGTGGIARRAEAILSGVDGARVVAICGRNRSARATLDRLTDRYGDRLTVHGFVHQMADWLRCADVVVGKAGPGTIAEATSCGAPLVLTSRLPGQERGNAEFVTAAGAGRWAPRIADLVATVDGLRRDPAARHAMRAASARLGRPDAALVAAEVVASASITATRPERRIAGPPGAVRNRDGRRAMPEGRVCV